MKQAEIQIPQSAYVIKYPEFGKIADEQMKIFWPWSEIKVEKDKQDLLVNMTPAEYHGVITTLKLFTKYELFVGNEYWLTRVMKMFPRPEIQRMAAALGHVELNSHAPFYNQINVELRLDTEEFYNSYVEDPVLLDRMNFIDGLVNAEDDAMSIAGFSVAEGAILYTSFAYLKHFQSKGKNKLINVVRGINMSVRDEHLHSIAGAGLFNTLVKEREYNAYELKVLKDDISHMITKVHEHETRIGAMIFEKGEMDGITEFQLDEFSKHRLNVCASQINIEPIYEIKDTTIQDYFYDGINNYQYNDFFSGVGREYQRDWDQSGFIWTPNNKVVV